MATVTAAAPTRSGSRPDPTRRLWQVPVFLLGLLAFIATYNGWLPIGPPDPSAGFLGDLNSLKASTEKLSPDPVELKAQLTRIASLAESHPDLSPAVHFALGSGYVRLAELTPDLSEAHDYWSLAKQHFDALRSEEIADPSDQPRFAFRAAKARAGSLPSTATQAEIDLIRQLLLHKPHGEEPGDAPRLIGELSLRLVPPDRKKAKEAFSAYIAEAGLSTPPASLARAKLRLSEVHRSLGDFDGAKKWLSQIGTDAPPDVLPTSKALLARIRMAESDWSGAAREWEQVRASPGIPPDLRYVSAYHLAVCRLLSRPTDLAETVAVTKAAAQLFGEASKSSGPEGAAAAVRLADLQLNSTDPEKHKAAVGLLTAAVAGVAKPTDYANELIPLTYVQGVFELAIQVLVKDQAFDSAVAAAEAYKAVAQTGHDREKRADVFAAWGNALQKANGDAAPKFSTAAKEYAELAALRTVDTDKAELYRRAAGLYRQAADPAAALAALQQILRLPKLPDEVIGPVWVDYAEGLLAEKRSEEALKAFQEAMLVSGPASTIARHRLARILIDSRDPRKVPLGIALLQQIAQSERVTPAEQDAHERALVELAHEQIRAGNFAEAEGRLRMQLKLYPAGPESGLAKLLLGVALIQRSDPKAKPPVPDPAKAREEALGLFEQLVSDVKEREKTRRAVERDQWLKTQASLRVVQVYLQLGRFNDVLYAGDTLRKDLAGTVDELIVLSLMYHAYKKLGKPEGAFTIRDQMRDVFDRLKAKPGVEWARAGEYSREYWEKVWFAVEPMK